ncbi:uncharacterized protein LOC129590315 [Paramacrobiotus metropolitanus]|uniref:uncharacterized protein LOC129590315 n=1 Tax=Paramacrobiotus metropolitanus TaxID=2943436 RepID=UPI002445F2C0|nr:uncharacterized protein LOC129590315 [Paramacrobiotus metropolitanus]
MRSLMDNPFLADEPPPPTPSRSFVRSKPPGADAEFLKDPLASLGITNDESLHKPSVFLDCLTTNKQQHDKIMANFGFFAEFRLPPLPLIGEIAEDAKFRRTVMHSIQVQDFAKTEPNSVDIQLEGFDDSSDWVSEDANEHIWKAVQNSAVPKKKKKKPKKKKKKDKKPTVMEDLMTPEEASLNYQIAIEEERLKRYLLEYKTATEHGNYLHEQVMKTRKRYDQEAQAVKSDQAQDDADLVALENEWSHHILAVEKETEILQRETEATVARLRNQIADANAETEKIKKEVAVWEAFRDGAMLQNLAHIESLTKSIEGQKTDSERYLALTDELIILSEKVSVDMEKEALNELCVRHVNMVRERIPPEELQGIEDNDILTAELATLDKIYQDLLQETDYLQKKILHQTAGAQALANSVYEHSARILQNTTLSLGDKTGNGSCLPKTLDTATISIREMECVKAKSGGLCVVGTGIFKTKEIVPLSNINERKPLALAVSSGFLEVPSIDARANSADNLLHMPETDIIKTVEAVTSVEREVRHDDPLQNYAKPVFLDEILHQI